MPSTLSSFYSDAFYGCSSLVSFTVHSNNDKFKAVDGVLYGTNSRGETLLCYPANRSASSFTVPDSVNFVNYGAFVGAKNLVSVTVPYSVSEIYSEAFENCPNLASVTFNSKIVTINYSAFAACAEDLTFRGAVGSTAHTYAVENNINFVEISLPKTAIMFGLFGAEGDNLTWIIYDDGELEIIGSGAMENWDYDYDSGKYTIPWYDYRYYITNVSIPSGVTNIGDFAFCECVKLNTVELPDTVTHIGYQAFAYCAFESIDLPDTINSIGSYAFGGCYNLTDVTIPASVTVIETNIFVDCYSLEEIKVADGNTAFTAVDGVLFSKDMKVLYCYPAGNTDTEYEIPSGTSVIYHQAFLDCEQLERIVIPNTATYIGLNTFTNCTALKEITLPANVDYIGYGALLYCESLEKITVHSKSAQINNLFASYDYNGVIIGYSGSTAETYAEENGYDFIPALDVKLLSASLSLYNNIAVNFKANKAALDAAGFTDVYAVFEFGGRTYTVTDYTVETMMVSGVETEVYVFAFKNLAPDRMNDTITATLHAAFNGEDYASNSVSYSVAKYCYNQLKKCTEKTALATVCVDLLNYGSATQVYTGYRTDALANADLTDAQKAWGTQEERELIKSTFIDQEPAVALASWKSASLKLREDITVEMKFQADDITGLYVEVEMYGRTYRIDEFGYDTVNNFYVVEFDKFSATHMSEIIKATIRDADGNAVSKVLTYSVESYAASKKNDEGTGDLVKAMMKYGDAAIAYGAEQN